MLSWKRFFLGEEEMLDLDIIYKTRMACFVTPNRVD